MKQLIILIVFLFTLNCETIIKERIDEILKETLNTPSNFTSYIKNLKAPMPKYVYGFSQEKVMNFVNGLPMREDIKLSL